MIRWCLSSAHFHFAPHFPSRVQRQDAAARAGPAAPEPSGSARQQRRGAAERRGAETKRGGARGPVGVGEWGKNKNEDMKNTFHYSTTVSGTGGIEHLTLGGTGLSHIQNSYWTVGVSNDRKTWFQWWKHVMETMMETMMENMGSQCWTTWGFNRYYIRLYTIQTMTKKVNHAWSMEGWPMEHVGMISSANHG